MSLEIVWAIALKDLRQFVRDRTLMLLMLLIPVLQLVLLAQATSQGIKNLPVGVLDLDRSMYSRSFIALLEAPDTLAITHYPTTWEEAENAVDQQDIWGLVVLPKNFARSLQDARQQTTVQLIADGSNTIAAEVFIGVVQRVIQRFTEKHRTDPSLGRYGMGSEGGISLETMMRYNPTLTSRPFTITAQFGIITYEIVLGVAALGLAREREIGTLEQLMVTPVRRYELLVGKMIPPGIVGLVDFFAMSLLIRFVFRIPIRGSYLLLSMGSLLFIIAEVAWGMMLSAFSATQQQAILMIFIQAIVDMAFSGYLVPVQNMPKAFAFLARFVPLQYYLVFVRAVVLKGASLTHVTKNLLTIMALAIAMILIAASAISRKLE
jgi:ABC-2 type transport system permease protein